MWSDSIKYGPKWRGYGNGDSGNFGDGHEYIDGIDSGEWLNSMSDKYSFIFRRLDSFANGRPGFDYPYYVTITTK